MSRTSALWSAWAARLAHKEPATPLAVYRLLLGTVGVIIFFDTVLGGAVEPIWLHTDHGGISPLHPQSWLVDLLGGAVPSAVWPLIWAAGASSLAVALGFGGRVSAFIALQCWIALFALNPGSGGGHDKILTNGLWILVLAGGTQSLSLDCRLRTGSWRDDTPTGAWPRYLLIFQLVLIYTVTGMQKVGPGWFPWGHYDAIYQSLLLPNWARWDLSGVLPTLYPLTQLATAITWLWEVSWGLVLLHLILRSTPGPPGSLRAWVARHDLRRTYVLIGLGMHGTIWALMQLGPFSLVTVSHYVLLWNHDEWRRLLKRRA